MAFELGKTIEDPRGKMFVFRMGEAEINVIEIKKGFSRGGHFHSTDTSLHVFAGKVEYREEDPSGKGPERVEVFSAPCRIDVPANMAHMMTAVEDSVMVEVVEGEYDATNYPKYRDVVEAGLRK